MSDPIYEEFFEVDDRIEPDDCGEPESCDICGQDVYEHEGHFYHNMFLCPGCFYIELRKAKL